MRRRGGDEDTGGDSNNGGTDTNQQLNKSSNGNDDGNGKDDSDDKMKATVVAMAMAAAVMEARWQRGGGGQLGGNGGSLARAWRWRQRHCGGGIGSGKMDRVFFNSYVCMYVGPIQTGFLRGFQKCYGGTGIVIPVKKMPQERKTQES